MCDVMLYYRTKCRFSLFRPVTSSFTCYVLRNFFILPYNWSQIIRIRPTNWCLSLPLNLFLFPPAPLLHLSSEKNSVLILLVFNQFFHNNSLRRSSLTPNTFLFSFTKTTSSANIVHQNASSGFPFVSSSVTN